MDDSFCKDYNKILPTVGSEGSIEEQLATKNKGSQKLGRILDGLISNSMVRKE